MVLDSTDLARDNGLESPLLDSILVSNRAHLQRVMDAVLELPQTRIGVFGIAFKENTDDLRESPALALLEHLIGKGRILRVFDPHVRLSSVYGSNQRFLTEAIPHIGQLMDLSLTEMLDWAEVIVIAQKPSAENSRAIVGSGLPVVDLTNLKHRPTAQRQAPASTAAGRP